MIDILSLRLKILNELTYLNFDWSYYPIEDFFKLSVALQEHLKYIHDLQTKEKI